MPRNDEAPPFVGLCPGEHLGDFYMPLDPGESTVCPQCDEQMVVYSRGDEAEAARLREENATLRIRLLRSVPHVHSAAMPGNPSNGCPRCALEAESA